MAYHGLLKGLFKCGLPLQTMVDRDGVQKTTLTIILEKVLKAGIDDICVVSEAGALFLRAGGC